MHRPLTLIAAVGAAVAPTLLVATASDAAQAALSCPAMALAGQPFTIDVTIDVGRRRSAPTRSSSRMILRS